MDKKLVGKKRLIKKKNSSASQVGLVLFKTKPFKIVTTVII
jgi:hypothetical protein